MNGYWLNQIRRAEVGLIGKVIMWCAVVFRPAEMRKMWKNHVNEMQNRLNREHHERNGWYMSRGTLVTER